MKILFISPYRIWGGAMTANLTIAKIIKDLGHDVVFNNEYIDCPEYDGMPINKTPYHSAKKRIRNYFVREMLSQGIDLIIWDSSMTIFYYREILGLKRRGVKSMAILHSLSLTQNLKGRVIDFTKSITLSCMNAIVYVSRFTLESWDRYYAIRKSKAIQKVIYNAVSPCISFTKNAQSNKIRLGFVGRFSSEKQPDLFAKLSLNGLYELHAFGDGPLLEQIKETYPQIHYHGMEKNQNKIYSQFDILVMTSLFENCPMVILEAMSRGIPCVVPKVGGIPEIVHDGEDGRMYSEYACINEAINDVCRNYKAYSGKCKENAEAYYTQSIELQWKDLLFNI